MFKIDSLIGSILKLVEYTPVHLSVVESRGLKDIVIGVMAAIVVVRVESKIDILAVRISAPVD